MLYSAFIVGILGSVHCLGMCGPLVMALPTPKGNRWAVVRSRLVYNAGRILTYSLIGLVAGSLGYSFTFATSGQTLSVVMGILLLIMLIAPSQLTRSWSVVQPLARLTGLLKQKLGLLLRERSLATHFWLGMLNGLLPCGLVYVALAGATVTGNSIQGAAYMALFGAGTLPVMLATALSGQLFRVSWRVQFTKLAPAFTLVLALLLILRGLNLGIPMVSPQITAHPGEVAQQKVNVTCCHKP